MTDAKKIIVINFFFRKPRINGNYSIERSFFSFINFLSKKNFKVNIHISPFESNGTFNRLFMILWAYFKQGDINHISGDINFINLFLNKKKTISTFLDCYLLQKLRGLKLFFFKKFWIIFPLRNSTFSIAISNDTKKELIKVDRNYVDKIQIIPVCYHMSLKRSNKIFNHNKPIILIIGTSENKNTVNSLKSLRNINCSVVIIGNLNDSVLKMLKKMNLEYRNYENLSDKQINAQYKKSDIILFPSFYEGFGLPVIEGQVCGKAVVTSNISPMKDIAGVNGACLVNPYKVKEIAKGILKIINNKEYRKKLISNGLKNSEHYSPKVVAKKYMSLYYRLCEFKK